MPRQRFTVKPMIRFIREEAGSILILTALASPMLIGGLGLGVETGHWYQKQRLLQHIADASAFAAAGRLRAGDSESAIYDEALAVARASGFDDTIGEFAVNIPPTSGPYAGVADTVEVIMTENRRRWFSAMFKSGEVELSGRAVSLIDQGQSACVLALSRTASGAITVSGSTSVSLEGCAIASNSVAEDAFNMPNNAASMTADCVHTVGQAVYSSQLNLTECDNPNTKAALTRDPYADREEPANEGSCERSSNVGRNHSSTTLSPTYAHSSGMNSMRFCDGVTFKGTVNLDPGLYIIDGGTLTVGSQTFLSNAGGGVTFLLMNGAEVKINGGASVNLSAPTSGDTSGILFWESKTKASDEGWGGGWGDGCGDTGWGDWSWGSDSSSTDDGCSDGTSTSGSGSFGWGCGTSSATGDYTTSSTSAESTADGGSSSTESTISGEGSTSSDSYSTSDDWGSTSGSTTSGDGSTSGFTDYGDGSTDSGYGSGSGSGYAEATSTGSDGATATASAGGGGGGGGGYTSGGGGYTGGGASSYAEGETNGASHKFNGGSNLSLSGALYLSLSEVTYNGGSSSENGCTQIIGHTVKFTGNSGLSLSCANQGTEEIEASEPIRMCE